MNAEEVHVRFHKDAMDKGKRTKEKHKAVFYIKSFNFFLC